MSEGQHPYGNPKYPLGQVEVGSWSSLAAPGVSRLPWDELDAAAACLPPKHSPKGTILWLWGARAEERAGSTMPKPLRRQTQLLLSMVKCFRQEVCTYLFPKRAIARLSLCEPALKDAAHTATAMQGCGSRPQIRSGAMQQLDFQISPPWEST